MAIPLMLSDYKLGGVSSISGTLSSVSGAFPTFAIWFIDIVNTIIVIYSKLFVKKTDCNHIGDLSEMVFDLVRTILPTLAKWSVSLLHGCSRADFCYNVKDPVLLRGLNEYCPFRAMSSILPVNGLVLTYSLYTSVYSNVNKKYIISYIFFWFLRQFYRALHLINVYLKEYRQKFSDHKCEFCLWLLSDLLKQYFLFSF